MAPRKEYVYPPGSETALDEPRICSMAYLMAHPCWCLKPATEVQPVGFPFDTVSRKLWHPEGQPRSTAQEARRRSFFTAAPALMSVPPPPPPPPPDGAPAANTQQLANESWQAGFGVFPLGGVAYATRVVDEQGVDEQSQTRSHRDRTVSGAMGRR